MGQKVVIVMFAVLALLILFAQYTKPDFVVSDQFERARISEKITAEQNFPLLNEIYDVRLKQIYPPLFDLQSAFGKILTGLNYKIQWNIISFVILLCIFVYSFKIARIYLEKNFALISAFFVSLLPWIFRRIVAPIPESIGLALFLILLYYLIKRNLKVVAILLPFLALFHIRSFITFLLIFIILGIYFLIKKEISIRKFFLPIASAAIFSGLWVFSFFANYPFAEFTNPWVYIFSITELFSFLWLFALFSVTILIWSKKHNLFNWFFIAGLVVMLFFGNTIFGFRELTYLFFPAGFLSAYLLQLIKEKVNSTASLFLFVILVFFLISANVAWIQQQSYFTSQSLNAVKALDNFEGKIVLSDFGLSYTIPFYSSKKVVIGPFMEQLTDSKERAPGSMNFFRECKSNGFLEKYAVELVHLTPFVRDYLNCSSESFNEFAKVFDSQDNEVLVVG